MYIAAHLPGQHTLWVVPKFTTADPVGPRTGEDVVADRIYRSLRIDFTIGNKNNVTSASVHHTTMANGTVTANVASVTDQVLDVKLQPVWVKSPYNVARNKPLDMIVVHKTGGPVIGPAINQFLAGGTSSHYIIDRDGQIVKMVLDGRAAGHASNENESDQSHWGTQRYLAYRSIGIENVGSIKQGLEPAQYQSLIRLIQELMTAYKILRHRVIGHSDILTDGQDHLSDQRIACPGFQFEWSQLENAKPPIGLARFGGSAGGSDPVGGFFLAMNVGKLFTGSQPQVLIPGDYDPQTVGGKLRAGKFGERQWPDIAETPITQLQIWLAEIGYSVGPANGIFNPRMARAVLHFQTHFLGPGATSTINQQTAALIRAVRDANPKAD